MIVRMFDRRTGEELKPISIASAARAIAKSRKPRPSWRDVNEIEDQLSAGEGIDTSCFTYVPDADGGAGPVSLSLIQSKGEGST